MKIEYTYNPRKFNLSAMPYVDQKYDIQLGDDVIVAEVKRTIQTSIDNIVAWQMGLDNQDFMMNQITVRLYICNDDLSYLN